MIGIYILLTSLLTLINSIGHPLDQGGRITLLRLSVFCLTPVKSECLSTTVFVSALIINVQSIKHVVVMHNGHRNDDKSHWYYYKKKCSLLVETRELI